MRKAKNNTLKIILIVLGVLLALALISALITLFYLTPKDSVVGPVQIANPASVNCVDLGGALEIREDSEGNQYGVCIKDGKECDEWALYRNECSL